MNTPADNTTPDSAVKSPGSSRRRGFIILGTVVLVGALGYLAYWFFDARYYGSTDDAYVNGDVVQITTEVPGTVLAVNVDDTQPVKAGQSLLELDPADARIAVGNAEADLARAVRQVRGLFAQSSELKAQIEQRQQSARTADDDLKRRGGLISDGAISAEELSHARDAVTLHTGECCRCTRAAESNRRADRWNHDCRSPTGAGRRGGGSQCGSRVAPYGNHLARHGPGRQAVRASGSARRRGYALDGP